MAAARPDTAQHFRSQLAFPGGALMCTSASVHWALACLHRRKDDLFAAGLLDTVMRWAADRHAEIGRVGGGARMLQHEEVVAAIGFPDSFARETYNGHHLDNASPAELAGFGRVVHMPAVDALLEPASACVVTANQHTVAAYRDATGALYLFDSLPGVERRLDGPDALPAAFRHHLGPFDVCDLTHFSLKPTGRRRTG